ncbi:MAG TPA: two-component regulator propeller domain-containing protein [Cyclobacteriaceae bacterium]|nr:hypothetical protein [Cyclobacteriaceae bacterium]HMX51016.1 two-component regulator propeller domain-containing protein [Cyclobacteriaceae bacterium]HNK80576.1 two-component regulator propeller domain-containing protein [Cyclobacteriaceae bacterium]HNO52180.1 two-component regulator propeller domain-containing protein [Cyclobacteriaceae bacterium]
MKYPDSISVPTMRLICILLIAQPVFAQDFSVTRYDVSDGLVDNSVVSITQDHQGFMWFGTREGLNRFDGKTFASYRPSSDLSFFPREAESLTEISAGHMAYVTINRLLMVNTKTKDFYRPDDFVNRVATNFLVDGPDILIGSMDTCFVAGPDFRIKDCLIPPSSDHGDVRIYAMDQSKYLMQHNKTFYFLNRKDRSFTRLNLTGSGLTDEQLFFAFYDNTRQWIYLSSYFTGIYRFSLEGKLLKHFPMYSYMPVGRLMENLLWIGSGEINGQAKILDLVTDEIRTFVLDGVPVSGTHSSFVDREGNNWIGTDKGLIKISAANKNIKAWTLLNDKPFAGIPLGLTKGNDGRMYTSLFSFPVLYRLSEPNDTWELIADNKFQAVWGVARFGQELVFSGGMPTYASFNPATNVLNKSSPFLKQYFPNSDILILCFRHSNGDEWFSGNRGGGLVRVRASDKKIFHYTIDGRGRKLPAGSFSYYSTCSEDENGNLWFGVGKTWLPLFWDKSRDEFSILDFEPMVPTWTAGLAGFNVITADRKGNVWFGCEGSGLYQYDFKRKKLKIYALDDGLASNYINSLQFDGSGRLWIGTWKGLCCLNPATNRIVTFTREDGLADDRFYEQCLFYDSSENILWAGASTAIMRFNPDSLLNERDQEVNVQLDEVLVNGKIYSENLASDVDLDYLQNNIQFRFVAPDFSNKRIEYSYQLNGEDKNWIDNLSGTTASYANLEPGTYAFFVRARYVGNNPWYTIKDPVKFTIATPWFKSGWFNIAVSVVSVLFVVGFVRFYYRRKTEQRLYLYERQQALEKERTRIATDMHDDFGASLSRIKFISEKLKLKEGLNPDLDKDLTKISSYSDEMAGKMNEIVWALNERFDSVEDLISFCRSYAAEYLDHHKIELDFSSQGITDVRLRGEARRNIYLVLKEALHNTVKHAEATRVMISFEQSRFLQIRYRDNGKGFDWSTVRPFANGLVNMEKRMSDVMGTFALETDNGVGITLTVPID